MFMGKDLIMLACSQTTPSHVAWIKEVLHFLELEKIRLTLSGSERSFKKQTGTLFLGVKSTDCNSD